MDHNRRYGSMAEIMAANKSLGETWFAPSVMRFFRTRIESGVLKGRYFITSEQFGDEPRLYSIRRAADDGSIETVAQRFESIRDRGIWRHFMTHCGIETCHDERRNISLDTAVRLCAAVGMQCRHSENDEATCVGFVVSKKIPDTASLAQEYARHTTKADLELAIKKVAERVRES